MILSLVAHRKTFSLWEVRRDGKHLSLAWFVHTPCLGGRTTNLILRWYNWILSALGLQILIEWLSLALLGVTGLIGLGQVLGLDPWLLWVKVYRLYQLLEANWHPLDVKDPIESLATFLTVSQKTKFVTLQLPQMLQMLKIDFRSQRVPVIVLYQIILLTLIPYLQLEVLSEALR